MCSIDKDIEEMSICSDEIRKIGKLTSLEICRKCGEKSILLLQKKDPLCRSCFLDYCNHKFRSTLGKSKKFKQHDTILLAFSGGCKSTAMVHLVKEMLKSASHKRLVVSPILCYINESVTKSIDVPFSLPEEIFKETQKFEFPAINSFIEMTLRKNECKEFYWDCHNQESLSKQNLPILSLRRNFYELFKSIKTLSAKLDFLKQSRLQLLVDIAKQAGCNHIFLGDSATDLAIQLLSDVALGRGSQISSNSCFSDDRYGISVCRPMREFLNKEIALFNYLQEYSYTVLPNLLTNTAAQSSIQRLTETFICNLQENFPATIFTIFRTGSKLSSQKCSSTADTCILCKCVLDNVNREKSSALHAFDVSYNLSNSSTSKSSTNQWSASNNSLIDESIEQKDINRFLKRFCHACTVTLEEIGDEHHKSLLLQAVVQPLSRQKMKEEIQSFLLEDE